MLALTATAKGGAVSQSHAGEHFGLPCVTSPLSHRREIALPQDDGRKEYIATQRAKVDRAIAVLEAEADELGALTTIGEVTIGCALGYLDFRYANEPWRPGHPKLTAWYEKVSALPALAQTVPPG